MPAAKLKLSPDEEFLREIELNCGKTLKVIQKTVGDVGCVVWDAALVLLHYLDSESFKEKFDFRKKKVVELGAGPGAVGLAAAAHGASVTLTDLQQFIPLMQANAECNKGLIEGEVQVRKYEWGTKDYTLLDSPGKPDIVIFSDCVYYPEGVEPLVQTLLDLTGKDTSILCSYEDRSIATNGIAQQKFREIINREFQVQEIPLDEMDPVYRSEDIHILHLRRQTYDRT